MFKQPSLKTRACLKINVNARAPKSGRGDDIFEVRCGFASFERLLSFVLAAYVKYTSSTARQNPPQNLQPLSSHKHHSNNFAKILCFCDILCNFATRKTILGIISQIIRQIHIS